MVLEFMKLDFLEVLPPWHKLSWHLGLKNATWYSSPRNSSTVLFVTFTSHSHFSLSLTRTHSQSPSHPNIQTPNPHSIGGRRLSSAASHLALSLWTHSHSPSHPNIQTPNPHSIGDWRLSSVTSHSTLSLR